MTQDMRVFEDRSPSSMQVCHVVYISWTATANAKVMRRAVRHTVREDITDWTAIQQCKSIDELIDWTTTERERRSSPRHNTARHGTPADNEIDWRLAGRHPTHSRPVISALCRLRLTLLLLLLLLLETSSQPSITGVSSVASTASSTHLWYAILGLLAM